MFANKVTDIYGLSRLFCNVGFRFGTGSSAGVSHFKGKPANDFIN